MHPASVELTAKILTVSQAAAAARLSPGRRFTLTPEVVSGVRLVLVDSGRDALVFSLWDRRKDVVALCGDAKVPSRTLLLAIDEGQLRVAGREGLSALSPSPEAPGLQYALLHYANCRQIRRMVNRLTASGPAAAAA